MVSLASAAPAREAQNDPAADLAKLLLSAGRALREGDYSDAESSYRRALVASPASVDAACGLAWTFVKMRRYAEAHATASGVLASAPGDARALGLSGYALMRSGRLREAADAFLRASQRDQSEPIAVAGLAEILFFTGNVAESRRFAEHAVRLRPDEPDFYFLLGQVAARDEQFEEAADAYSRYLKLAPRLDAERRARIKAVVDCCRALLGKRLYVQSGPTAVSVPLRLSATRLPLVEVRVNGQGPFRFAIDTGAGFTVVSEQLAKRLKMRPIAKGGTTQGVGGGGTFPLVYGLVSTLSVGGLGLENVPVYIRASHQDASDPIDGYLGLAIFSRFFTAVDYTAGRFELGPRDGPVAEIGPADVELAYQVTAGGMYSVATDVAAAGPLNFVVDTGASITVLSSDALARYGVPSRPDADASTRVVGAAGVMERVQTIVLDRLAVDGMTPERALRRSAVRALVIDLAAVNETSGFEVSGIIGGNVLRDFRLELDPARGRLILRGARGR